MSGSRNEAGTSIKYETPYQAPSAMMTSPQVPLKRRHSNTGVNAEKRQRIGSSSSGITDEMAAIIAQATASATKSFTPASDYSPHRQSNPSHTPPSTNYQIHNREQRNGSGTHEHFYTSDPHLYMRILSLPILESLSTQIISTLAQGPYSETIKIITDPKSDLGQTYATLKSLFDQTKKIYSQQEQWLSADELNIKEPEHRATIRITNLATFVSSVFGGEGVSFYELNDHFVETFTPDNKPLQKDTGELYLNLKTQMYLSAVSQEEQDRTKEDILEDLFPIGMRDFLMGRHPSQTLAPSEVEFVEATKARREYLLNSPSDVDAIQTLSERFAWEDFLRSLSSHLSDAYRPLMSPYMKRHALTAPANPSPLQHVLQPPKVHAQQPPSRNHSFGPVDITAEAERAAEAAIRSILGGNYQPSQNRAPQQQQSQTPQPYYSRDSLPNPTQTAPTQILYERARQAAAAKANPGTARRPGLPSQRRPWSGEEENALMTGLDQVKGPHWSQILALYGSKGSINEILKDRNQVQLKDKARNLKLFFLKAGIEVPYYLKSVTGELKTRAPSQAARKEAEERARIAGDEEQARADGILTLAGGLHDRGGSGSQDSEDGEEEAEELVVESSRSPEQGRVGFRQPNMSEADQLRQTLLGTNGSSAGSQAMAI